MPYTRATPPLPSLLVLNRNFVLLWAGYGVAAIGDHLSEIALLKSRNALEGDNATRVQALISFGFFLPFVLLGPFAGWCADRFPRKWMMILADLLRAAVVFNLAWIVAALAGVLGEQYADFSIVIPLAVVGALAAFFSPARQAMLPTLIRDNQLVRANALISALGTIGTIISAVVGGLLVQHAGPTVNFHLNALTFVLSACFVACISMQRTRAVPHAPLDGVLTPVVAGFRYVYQHRRVMQMILLGVVFWAAAGVVISVTPAIVKVFYPNDYSAAGTFRGVIGIGLATGAAVMTLIGPSLPTQLAVLAALLGGGTWVALLCLAVAFQWGAFFTGVCLFGIGGGGAALLVTIMATLQHLVPDSRRGRIFGVSDTATMGAMVLATGLLGLPHIPRLDTYVPWILAIVALAFFVTLVVAWRIYLRRVVHRGDVWLTWKTIQFLCRFWWRTQRIGPCTIPRHGPVILASNHTAGIDPLVQIGTSCDHRFPAYIVAEEYYHVPIAKYFMAMVHCIPVDRKNPGKAFYVAALKHLRAGGCLGIFPQGQFERPDEEAPEGKSGVGLIALRTGATVIPCHISGTRYFNNPFAAIFFRHNVRIRYGRPIDLSAFAGREKDKAAAEEASELIMQRIRELAPREGEPGAAKR